MMSRVISGACSHLRRLGTRSLSKEVVETNRIEKTVNHVMILGRVGADPQLRGSKQHPVIVFSLATHTNYKQGEGEDFIQRTEWHRISVFKPSLRDAVYSFLKKGQRAMVQGRLTYGQLHDTDGTPKYITTIIADDVVFFNQ